jgi:hypothetical protein
MDEIVSSIEVSQDLAAWFSLPFLLWWFRFLLFVVLSRISRFPPSLSLFFLFLKSYLMPNVLIVLCSFARDPHELVLVTTPSMYQQLAWSLGTFNMLNFADGRLPSLREEPHFVP